MTGIFEAAGFTDAERADFEAASDADVTSLTPCQVRLIVRYYEAAMTISPASHARYMAEAARVHLAILESAA